MSFVAIPPSKLSSIVCHPWVISHGEAFGMCAKAIPLWVTILAKQRAVRGIDTPPRDSKWEADCLPAILRWLSELQWLQLDDSLPHGHSLLFSWKLCSTLSRMRGGHSLQPHNLVFQVRDIPSGKGLCVHDRIQPPHQGSDGGVNPPGGHDK